MWPCLARPIPLADGTFLTTGRITYEMVIKAATCGTPIVASRKAVSDLAVEIAEALRITLVGYVRGGHITVYTHPHRIAQSEDDRIARGTRAIVRGLVSRAGGFPGLAGPVSICPESTSSS